MKETGYQQAILYLLGQDTGGKRLVRCVDRSVAILLTLCVFFGPQNVQRCGKN